MKVLLADDTPSSRMLVRSYIENAGHAVLLAEDGEQAVRIFNDESPDLILMDVVMPIVDGYEAARYLKDECNRRGIWIPIVFLTALGRDDDLARGILAGGDDYLIKPVSEVVLNAKLIAMQRIAEMRHQLQAANAQLKRLSVIDSLTGIANRRHFDETFAHEYRRALRERQPLSLLLMDVDHFKAYNDHYGHQAGDDCLKQVAQTIARGTERPADLAARYGGEEFVVVLPNTAAPGARHVAEGIRGRVEALRLPHEKSSAGRHVTLSIGAVTFTSGTRQPPGAGVLLQLTDRQLYLAKKSGRNRVECAEVRELSA